jgi:hypothetical protein
MKKTMKKIYKTQLAVVIILLFITKVHSQGIYFSVGGGYGISATNNAMANTYERTTNNIQTTTYDVWGNPSIENSSNGSTSNKEKMFSGSLGKGVKVGATVGYMFTENIGAELGISYLIGGKIIDKYTSTTFNINRFIYQSNPAANYTTSTTSSNAEDNSYSAKMFRLTPAFKLQAGKGQVKPYLRLGLIIGLATNMKYTYTDVNVSITGVTSTTDRETKYTGGVSLGFDGGAGVTIKFNDIVGLFVELDVITQSWSPKRAKLTKLTEDGIDQLPTMTTREKETEYSRSISNDWTSADDPHAKDGSPNQSLKFHMPFSSAGLNVGVAISLGKKQ